MHRGLALFLEMEILPAFLLAPHPEANFGCDSKKWEYINGLHLSILAIKGGLYFRNGNTFRLSASTTLTHKLYFCSQTLAVMVKTMGMYKWAPLNPI